MDYSSIFGETSGVPLEWRGLDSPPMTLKASIYSKSIQFFAIALIENGVTGLRGLAFSNDGGKMQIDSKTRRRARCADEDRAWFMSKDDSECSFVWCCEILGADPDYERKILLPLYMTTQHDGRKPKMVRRVLL